MGDWVFQRWHCWCAFSWSICNQNSHFIRCIQSSSFQGYCDIHIMGGHHQLRRVSGQKPKLSEWDCSTLKRIVSVNQRSTAAGVTSWRRFPQKQSDESFINPTSMVQLQLLNLWLLITALKGEKDGMITKPGHLMIENT